MILRPCIALITVDKIVLNCMSVKSFPGVFQSGSTGTRDNTADIASVKLHHSQPVQGLSQQNVLGVTLTHQLPLLYIRAKRTLLFFRAGALCELNIELKRFCFKYTRSQRIRKRERGLQVHVIQCILQ